jgi:hypothetical protein
MSNMLQVYRSRQWQRLVVLFLCDFDALAKILMQIFAP